MAVRIQTQADINFGNMGAQVTATHIRFQKPGANPRPVVRQLAAPVTVAAGAPLILPSGLLDIVYVAGDLNNTHLRGLIDPYWANQSFELDMLTDANTVVADAGYNQRTYQNWSITEEAD